MKKYIRAIWCTVAAVMLAVSAAIPALAIDIEKPNTLTLQELPAKTEFHIYRVADTSDDASTFTAAGDFAKYSVELNGLDTDGWRAAASTLAGYVLSDEIPSLVDGKADEDGELEFVGLDAGLYLVMGDTAHKNGEVIRFTPFLIHLPGIGDNGEWSYSQTVTPKYEIEPEEPITKVEVKKIWKDSGSESSRPKSITVQLLKDGKEYDKQILNEKNNWSYKWKDLDAKAEWTVTEKDVPAGYKVQSTKEGKTWIITNTSDKPNKPGKPGKPHLPKTGLLWWPVPILFVVGLGLISLGISKGKKNEK